MIFCMMKDNDLRYFAFEFYISIFDGLKVIRVQQFLGTLLWCYRGHRIFIFDLMKECDPNFIDFKLQIPNFIGSKVISFQSESIFSKIS